MARPDPLPAHLTGDQIEAAMAALGLDVLELKAIRSVRIEPSYVEVVSTRQDENGSLLASGYCDMQTTTVIGIRWTKPKDASQ